MNKISWIHLCWLCFMASGLNMLFWVNKSQALPCLRGILLFIEQHESDPHVTQAALDRKHYQE